MLFDSLAFLLFFIVVTTLYFLLPFKGRWILLLLGSCFFYMFFKPIYILILFFTILVDYLAGILIEQEKNLQKKQLLLTLSIVSNVGVLAFFKYFNFVNESISSLGHIIGIENKIPYLPILLPIGLSFHTFQAMSYTFEVYYGRQKAERHLGIYSLYVMFYPQLVAGPIERPQNILPQLKENKTFSFENAKVGISLIAFGLFKKIVVADRLAIYVNEVYRNVESMNSISVFLAMIFFSFQIYCDFSGYSDIARGTAKFMGYDLMLNFNRPYASQSISEFWTRWHISLSTWFRDYLYIPLGGNRVSRIKWLRNLSIVFLLSGIWHGANWTYMIWGALHAVFLIFAITTINHRKKFMIASKNIDKIVNQFLVFLLVSFAWIFFRAETISLAIDVIKKLFSFDFSLNMLQLTAYKGPLNLFITFIVLGAWYFISVPDKRTSNVRTVVYLIFLSLFIIFTGKSDSAAFIYFQF